MFWVSSGISRNVFLVGKWAIKIPSLRNGGIYFLYGLLGNMLEARRYRTVYELFPCDTYHLGRVIYCAPLGVFLVMQRYNKITGKEKLIPFPKSLFKEVDNKSDNFATDGKYTILVDYGNTGWQYEPGSGDRK